jgi:hypothetical protein
MSPNHLAREGRRRGGKLRRWGERRSPRAGLQPAPGRSGHHVCRHYDRHARCVAGSGPTVGGVTPAAFDGLPTKPGPDRTKGPHTPWEEPWWNAGRRAVLSHSGDSAAPQGAEVGPASSGVPYPFIFGETGKAKRRQRGQPPLAALFAPASRFMWLRSGDPRAKARAGMRSRVLTPLPACGERSSEARVRGPLRDSERCAAGDSVADAAANSGPGGEAPHPTLSPRAARGNTVGTFRMTEDRKAPGRP